MSILTTLENLISQQYVFIIILLVLIGLIFIIFAFIQSNYVCDIIGTYTSDKVINDKIKNNGGYDLKILLDLLFYFYSTTH